MKLYWGPHTCALGIQILLEEVGRPYEAEQIDVAGGATHTPAFLRINSKGKVPTLIRDDGSVLTEFGAIATWLARTNTQKALIPDDPDSEARMIEVLEYVEGTVHGQGFSRIFAPARYAPPGQANDENATAHAAIKKQGKEIVEQGFALLDEPLGQRPFAAGARFSIADAALFYVERWASTLHIKLPSNIAAHYERVRRRPSVTKVLKMWNES